MTLLVNEAMVDLALGNAALIALTGYLVVFFGLVLLMCVIIVMGKIMVASRQKKAAAAAAAAAAPAPAAEPAATLPEAPGTAGEFMLHDVDPKIAAMAMAIVADKMGKPLNELRFKSIKEVK